MALKYKIKSLDEVAEEQRGLYKQSEDGETFTLIVEGLPDGGVPKEKLDEFRNNNIKLFREKEALEKRLEAFKDIDPEEYLKLKELADKIDESKLLDSGKIDEVVTQRTERMRTDFMNQIKALSEKIKEAEQKESKLRQDLGVTKINNTIQTEVTKMWKIKPNAMKLIIQEGKQIFKLDENNEPVALEKNGGTMVGKDGMTPLTITEWVENLPNDFPFLFEEGEGIGSKKGGRKGGNTELQRIKAIKDPQERLRLARKAGLA